MSITRFIGDVHGRYRQYGKITAGCQNSIQFGDLGVGFRSTRTGRLSTNPPYDKMVAGNHRFIRGNHDNPQVCMNHTQWIPDGTIENDVMFVGGALSIDREYRTEGFSYWPDEELSQQALNALVHLYSVTRPRIMVTHECPEKHAEHLMAISGRRKLDYPSRTRQAFQSMWEIRPPEIWIHGHWHTSLDITRNTTRFIGLAELGYIDLEIAS